MRRSADSGSATVSESLSTRELVLGMVSNDGVLHAAELYDVAQACGYTVHQVRLCLSRLVDEGVLVREGRGRRAVFEATDAGHRQLDPEIDFLRLAWAQDDGLLPWDGSWHLVAFSIDESQRSARTAIREYLVDVLGGGHVQSGLYVSAHPWEELVLEMALAQDITDRVLVAQSSAIGFGGFEDPRQFAKSLWSLDELGDAWAEFVERSTPVVESLPAAPMDDATSTATALGDAVRIAGEFGAVMHTDPLLPPELLPDRWPGVDARRLMVAANTKLAAARAAAGVPALYRRFDDVMSEVGRGGLRVADLLASAH